MRTIIRIDFNEKKTLCRYPFYLQNRAKNDLQSIGYYIKHIHCTVCFSKEKNYNLNKK